MAKFKDIMKKKLASRISGKPGWNAFPIVKGFQTCNERKGHDECCQGCSLFYRSNDVMIIDEVGPVCFNCCYDTMKRVLS